MMKKIESIIAIAALLVLSLLVMQMITWDPSRVKRSGDNALRAQMFDNPRKGVMKNSGRFCVTWNDNKDEWWTHHPEWIIAQENSTHTCFRAGNDKNTRYRVAMYKNQWNANCSDVFVWKMWSSGWGADLSNVAEGLIYGLEEKKPFAIYTKVPWHYTTNKDGSNSTCPAKDMSCYFLPMGKCDGKGELIGKYKSKVRYSEISDFYPKMGMIASTYIARQQQWLRKAVVDYSEAHAPTLMDPCSVIHVRRADVVLRRKILKRGYFPISDYLEVLPTDRKQAGSSMLLLTDDQNAIDEAHEFFPHINWKYFNRTRFRGKEGGWESQVPSKNPKLEVIVLLSTFRVVKQCDILVNSESGFANSLHAEMSTSGKNVTRFVIGTGKEGEKRQMTAEELEEHLEKRRKRRGDSTTEGSS